MLNKYRVNAKQGECVQPRQDIIFADSAGTPEADAVSLVFQRYPTIKCSAGHSSL